MEDVFEGSKPGGREPPAITQARGECLHQDDGSSDSSEGTESEPFRTLNWEDLVTGVRRKDDWFSALGRSARCDGFTGRGTPGGRVKFTWAILTLKCPWEMSNRPLEMWGWADLRMPRWGLGVWWLAPPVIQESLLCWIRSCPYTKTFIRTISWGRVQAYWYNMTVTECLL